MSIESYIEAMPKAELHVHLEGAVSPEELLLIAEQNEVAEQIKHFNTWAALVQKPDYERLDDIIRVACQWVQLPEDLTRIAYNVGTNLSKQNVRYAEVSVTPALYSGLSLSLEQFFAALNDGRERAERAWGIRIGWVLTLPRDEPRRGDEYVRFATSPGGRRANIVALGLAGTETAHPVGQFERTFVTAEKKGLPRVVHAGEILGAEGVLAALQTLSPNRVVDGWGISESKEVRDLMHEKSVSLDVSMIAALRRNRIADYQAYPLRQLYDDGVVITLGADMPELFQTTLNEQYTIVVRDLGFDLEELEEIALNVVRVSALPEDERETLLGEFRQTYDALRAEHIEAQTE